MSRIKSSLLAWGAGGGGGGVVGAGVVGAGVVGAGAGVGAGGVPPQADKRNRAASVSTMTRAHVDFINKFLLILY